MSYQIVCLSCGYHRAWTTLTDALADGHRHHRTPCAPIQPTREGTGATGSDQSSP
jgi:hypothetical protein